MSTQDLADGRLTPFNGYAAPTWLACDNCGNAVHAGSIFCTSCGRSLVAPAATDAEPPSTPPAAKMCCLSLGVLLVLVGLAATMMFRPFFSESISDLMMVAIVLMVLVCPALCIWCFISNGRCGSRTPLNILTWSLQTYSWFSHANALRRWPMHRLRYPRIKNKIKTLVVQTLMCGCVRSVPGASSEGGSDSSNADTAAATRYLPQDPERGASSSRWYRCGHRPVLVRAAPDMASERTGRRINALDCIEVIGDPVPGASGLTFLRLADGTGFCPAVYAAPSGVMTSLFKETGKPAGPFAVEWVPAWMIARLPKMILAHMFFALGTEAP